MIFWCLQSDIRFQQATISVITRWSRERSKIPLHLCWIELWERVFQLRPDLGSVHSAILQKDSAHWPAWKGIGVVSTLSKRCPHGMILGNDFVMPKPTRREMKLACCQNEFQEPSCGMDKGEKVAKAYHKAGKRGGKGKFLKLWADKYNFKLS